MTKEEAIKYLQQLYPNGGHCWLDEQRIEAIGIAINALQEEPASEDLEQASEEYAYTNWESDDYHEGASEGKPFDAIGHTRKCFIDGAQWQKTQDQQTIELAEEHAMLAGMMQEREKMMKDAIEGEIIGCPDGALGSAIRFQCYALREVAHFPITAEIGKKVKIIIIKE